MTIPVRASFKGTDACPALEARIRERAARLERFAGGILRCDVTVEAGLQASMIRPAGEGHAPE